MAVYRFSQLPVLLLLASVAFTLGDNSVSPPVFTKPEKQDTRYVDEAVTVTLECQAEGTPKPTYWWWKDSAPMKVSDRVKIHPAQGTLELLDYSYREDGHYMCVATSEVTTPEPAKAASFSPVQWVRQKRVGKLSEDPQDFEVLENTYVMIPCNTTREFVVTDMSYKWYNGEESNQLSDKDGGRIYVDTKGNLHFTWVKESDDRAEDNLAYRCGVSGTTLNAIFLGAQNKLKVKPSQDNMPVPFRLVYSNSGLKVRLYSTASLECVFAGFEPASSTLPRVTWVDNNNRPIGEVSSAGGKYSISADTRQLTIRGITMEDEGDYKCSISNSDPHPVRLDVTSPPYFKDKEDRPAASKTLPEGANVTLVCDAVSMQGEEPPETPLWYINGVKFSSAFDYQRYQLSVDSKRMTISNLRKPQDTQCLQCMTKNDVGTTWADGCITIILSIQITTPLPPKQQIKKGDLVVFTLVASSDPSISKLSYIWSFKGKNYVDVLPPFVERLPMGDFINTTELTDSEYSSIEGTYTVDISNVYETKTVKMEVVLVDEPAPLPQTKSSGGFPMWIIIVIVCVLIVIVIIILIVCVVCRKKLEGDYNVDKKETGAGLNPEKELKTKGFDDFSRPQDYDEYDFPENSRRDIPFEDDALVPDEQESEDEEAFFNEDGSFIGQYHNKKLSRPATKDANESNI